MQVAGTWMQGQQLEDVQQAERLKLGSLKVREYRRKRSFYSIYLFKKKSINPQQSCSLYLNGLSKGDLKMGEEKDHPASSEIKMYLCFGFHFNV